jgi:hypothetical protein
MDCQPSALIPDSDTLLDETESSLTDALSVIEPSSYPSSPVGPRHSMCLSYIFVPHFLHDRDWNGGLIVHYRVYSEGGAIPSKTSATPDHDPFLGRIKARSVPPPHTVHTLKRSLAKFENINDRTGCSLFLTPYSQSPMDDTTKVTIRNHTGPGFLPQEPLALVVKLTDSERSALEFGEMREGPNTTSSNTRYRTPFY